MLDLFGTFLHELLHVEYLAGIRINDSKDNCYSWYGDYLLHPLISARYLTQLLYSDCITKAAKPDNGGEDRPWNIAKR